jgi:hypothetical protein
VGTHTESFRCTGCQKNLSLQEVRDFFGAKHNVSGPSTLCSECSVYGYCASCGEQIQRTATGPSTLTSQAPEDIECSHCHVPVLTADQILAHHGQTEEAELHAENQAKKIYMSSGFQPGAKISWFDDPEDEVCTEHIPAFI